MTRLKAGLQWGLWLTIVGTLLVYIPTSVYVGILEHLDFSPTYVFIVIRIIAIVLFALKNLFTIPFQETQLFLLIVVNSLLLFFPVGFYWRVTRSDKYEYRRHHEEPGNLQIFMFLWVMVCAAIFFVAALGGKWSGSVLEYWTWTLGRVIFFLSAPVIWGLYNFKLSIESRREMEKHRLKMAPWLAAKEGWYARAAAATNREESFAVVDEFYEHSQTLGIYMDEPIKQGFGISEEATDALIMAWAADRKREPLRLPPEYRFPPQDMSEA